MKSAELSGVNLGGWLVVEKWMTPSLFEGTNAANEYDLVQTAAGKQDLREHHKTFITEADFKWLNHNQITSVRIPVGYWIFGDEAPYIGAIERLDWALRMADTYNIKVLIDLHGAPGAQNAADHSGSGKPGLPIWLDDAEKQECTIRVLERLVERYNKHQSFWGIEIINEPLADRLAFKLIRFYRRAYKRLLNVARPGLVVVFSDGFRPYLLTGALWQRKKLPVVMDCHFYQCFSAQDKSLSLDQHLKKAARRQRLIRFLQLWQPIIVGEWSGVLPWSLLKQLSEKEREEARYRYMREQMAAYRDSHNYFYWNYKTEKDSGWNLRAMVENDSAMLQLNQ